MKPRFEHGRLRKTIIEMAYAGSSNHIACAFSLVEILAVLYRNHLRLGDGPEYAARDYLVLSKGHGIMAQYACLFELGWLSEKDMKHYFQNGTRLKGLADAHVPGVEVSSGSLGHGLSVGVGLACASRRRGTDQKVFAIVGDGECNEGSIWEALLFAAHHRLSNLIVIVDANGYQAMGLTVDVMNLGSLKDKFSAFGFETREVDGHDERHLHEALNASINSTFSGPRAIIAQTVKGKGISFMQRDNSWHYQRLTPETYQAALLELESEA